MEIITKEGMETRMANPLFNEQMHNSFNSQLSSFKSNPLEFLLQHKINIPDQYANDPRGAIQYLLNNGQMSQQQLNMLMQMAQRMGIQI